jgi:hypothetical protein
MKKIKDKGRKNIVDEYNKMVQRAINRMESTKEKLSPKMKWYIKGLKDSIKESPYLLGYLHRPPNKDIELLGKRKK